MCKLAIVLKEQGADMRALRELLDEQYPSMETQPDGIGALTIGHDNKVKVSRKLDVDEYDGVYIEFIQSLENAKIGILHTRIGTIGGRTLENVHQYESNGLVFAHNGHVGALSGFSEGGASNYGYRGYSQGYNTPLEIRDENHLASVINTGSWYSSVTGYVVKRKYVNALYNNLKRTLDNCPTCSQDKDVPCDKHMTVAINMASMDDLLRDGYMGRVHIFGATKTIVPVSTPVVSGDSDSKKFLDLIGKKPTIEAITSLVESQRFNGIASLVDTKTKTLFLIGTRQYEVQRGQGWIVIYSWKPKEKYNKVGYLFGLPVKGEGVNVPSVPVEAGVYAIDYGKPLSEVDTVATW